MYYKDQKITLVSDIGAFIVSFASLFAGFCCFYEFIDGHFGIGILALIMVLCLSISGVFFYVGLANILNARYNRRIAKKIIDNGVKAQGTITGI